MNMKNIIEAFILTTIFKCFPSIILLKNLITSSRLYRISTVALNIRGKAPFVLQNYVFFVRLFSFLFLELKKAPYETIKKSGCFVLLSWMFQL